MCFSYLGLLVKKRQLSRQTIFKTFTKIENRSAQQVCLPPSSTNFASRLKNLNTMNLSKFAYPRFSHRIWKFPLKFTEGKFQFRILRVPHLTVILIYPVSRFLSNILCSLCVVTSQSDYLTLQNATFHYP